MSPARAKSAQPRGALDVVLPAPRLMECLCPSRGRLAEKQSPSRDLEALETALRCLYRTCLLGAASTARSSFSADRIRRLLGADDRARFRHYHLENRTEVALGRLHEPRESRSSSCSSSPARRFLLRPRAGWRSIWVIVSESFGDLPASDGDRAREVPCVKRRWRPSATRAPAW